MSGFSEPCESSSFTIQGHATSSSILTDARGGKNNQDVIFKTSSHWGMDIYVVADGHGNSPNNIGEWIARVSAGLVLEFPVTPPQSSDPPEQIQEYFFGMFKYVRENLLYKFKEEMNFELRDGVLFNGSELVRGGTTLTVVYHYADNVVITANCGDSDAIIFGERPMLLESITGDHDIISSFGYINLCGSHSPFNPREKEVINKAVSIPGMSYLYDALDGRRPAIYDSSDNVVSAQDLRRNGFKLYTKNVEGEWAAVIGREDVMTYYLAYTRSIGDWYLEPLGKTSIPSISKIEMKPGDVIALASDGVWDVVTKQYVKDLLLIDDGCSLDERAEVLFSRTEVKSSPFKRSQDNSSLVLIGPK